MNPKEHINYWLESANHDLISAKEMFKSGRYDWCLFVGHLSLEKLLKAIYVHKNKNQLPPRTHNLVRLTEISKIGVTEEQKVMLDKITDFNIQTRYPDFKLEFYKRCTKEYSEKYLNEIQDLHRWLLTLLK